MTEIEKRLMPLSDDQKIEALEEINFDYFKAKVIVTLQSDDKKIEALEKINDNFAKARVIVTLQDDDKKIEALEKLSDDFAKAKVIESIQDDDKRIDLLEKISADAAKSKVISILQDDDKKIDLLEKISSDSAKARVIESLQDDDKKIETLEKIKNDFIKVKVIKNLQDDDKKIEALEKINDDSAKVKVIENLQNDDKKIDLLEKLSDDSDKIKVIESLQDDDKKIEALEKLSDDSAKARVIAILQDDDKKIDLLEKLSDDSDKAKVIESLQDDNQKIDLLEKLNDEFTKAILLKNIKEDSDNLLDDREKLKETFLDENRMYSAIGIDENMTIGMEIESEGVMSSNIQKLKKIVKKQVNGETKEWNTKGDDSLNDGVEVVSPILTDNKEDVEDIYIVCSMLQKCGNKVSERCGGHIHIGADYLKSKEAYVNLFEIWGNPEKIIYKMSNEIGTIPRMGLKEYAPPISPKFNKAIEKGTINLKSEKDLEQFISEIQEVQERRFSALNLLNVNNGKNTIEFRISNGTINPNTWIENTRLYGRIMQISQKLAEIEKQPEHSKEDKKLLELKDQLKEEIPEQEKMEILLELLFSEEERKLYRERYISSSKLLEQIPDEKNPFKGTEFSRVDFNKKKKHSLVEFHDVAVNDRIEAIDEVTRETVQGVRTEDKIEQVNNKNMEER